jgi:hypothetical protein
VYLQNTNFKLSEFSGHFERLHKSESFWLIGCYFVVGICFFKIYETGIIFPQSIFDYG